MLKKIAALGVVLAASSNIAFADSTTTTMHHRHHHHHQQPAPAAEPAPSYKGEVAPMAINYFEPSWYLGASVGARTNDTNNRAPSVYKGLQGNLFGGYGGAMNEAWYLAGELAVGDSIQLVNHTSRRGSVRSGWDATLSILPGYMLTQDSLAYLRAGIGETNFTGPSTTAFTGILGLGLQVALCRSWDLRGEYSYAVSRSIRGGVPQSQEFNLGLLYKFL